MSNCTYKFDNIEFSSLKELESYFLAQLTGVKFKRSPVTGEQVSQELDQVADRLTFVEDGHTYHFGSQLLTSVTTIIQNDIVDMDGVKQTPKGEASRKIGQRYHDIGEMMVKGLNDGKTFDQIKVEDGGKLFTQTAFVEWGELVEGFYKKWTTGEDGNPNGNIVKSEFKIANIEKGLAGTVDIAVITPTGDITLYDFKGSAFKYGEHDKKLDANASQLLIYKKMLETPDTKTGMKGYNVLGAHIIAIHSDIIADQVNGDFEGLEGDGKKFRLLSKTYEGTFNINSTKFRQTEQLGKKVASLFSNTAGSKNNGLRLTTETKEGTFKAVSGYDFQVDEDNEIPAEETIESQNHSSKSSGLSQKIADSFYFGYSLFEDNTDGTPYNPLAKLFKRYDKSRDFMVAANSIEGMETADPDIVVVYRNYDRATGEFSHVDFVSIDTKSKDPNQNTESGRTTIFGKQVTNRAAQRAAVNIHASNMALFKNNRHDNKAMEMGMLAMRLAKENPGLKVGNITVETLSTGPYSKGKSSLYSMDRVLKHLKLTKKLKGIDGKLLSKNLPEDIQEMLDQTKYADANNYAFSEVANYALFVMDRLSNEKDKRMHKSLKAWYDINLAYLIPTSANREELLDMADAIRDDKSKHKELLHALLRRMTQIRNHLNETSTDGSYLQDNEYQSISKLVLYLHEIVPSLDNVSDMGMFGTHFDTSGFTGVPLLDGFTKAVVEATSLMERDLIGGYVSEKLVHFRKLFGEEDSKITKAKNSIVGYTSKYFEPLLEVKEYTTKSGKKVKRKTMSFWAEGSQEFLALSKDQREFITWYNDKVEEYFKTLLPRNRKGKGFDQYWKRGDLPIIKASTSNIAYKYVTGTLDGTRKEGGYKGFWRTLFERKVKQNRDRTDEGFLGEDQSIDEINTYFSHQLDVPFKSDEDNPDAEYDMKADRRRALGIDENGLVDDEFADVLETNLETVLNFVAVGSKSKEYLEPLIPLHKAVQTIIALEQETTGIKYDNMRKYTEVYGMANLNRIRQRTLKSGQADKNTDGYSMADIGEAGINTTSSLAAQSAVAWNLASGMKNFLAGHPHQLSNMTAKALGGNWKDAKANAVAFGKVWKMVTTGDGDKLHWMMYTMGLATTDVGNILRDLRLQAGGQHILSSRVGSAFNMIGDYYHRTVMTVTQMVLDGSFDAWTFDEASQTWQYDEDKDPRFKTEEGKGMHEHRRAVMTAEGTMRVMPDGTTRMISPYTQAEIEKIRKDADMTFQIAGSANNAIYSQWAIGRAFMSLQTYAVSKRERYYKTGMDAKVLGKWVPRLDEDGKPIYGEYDWQGHHMEGILQTVGGLSSALWDTFSGKDKSAFADFRTDMTEIQKENLGRLVYDVAITSMLVALLRMLFDDEDDEKTLAYYVSMGAVQEANFFTHMSGFYNIIQSPFAALGILTNNVKGILSGDPRKILYSLGRFAGPGKIPEQADKWYKEMFSR